MFLYLDKLSYGHSKIPLKLNLNDARDEKLLQNAVVTNPSYISLTWSTLHDKYVKVRYFDI